MSRIPLSLLNSQSLYNRPTNMNSTDLTAVGFVEQITTGKILYNATTGVFSYTSSSSLYNQDISGINSATDLGQNMAAIGWLSITPAGSVTASGNYSNVTLPTSPAGGPAAPAAPSYTSLKLGHFIKVTGETMDLSGSKVINVAPSVNPTDAINQSELTSAVTTLQTQITTESTRASQIVSTEQTRAIASEAVLQSEMDQFNTNLNRLYLYLFNTTASTPPTR